MKPFDLKKALVGEPVVTRKGEKAFVLNNLDNLKDKGFIPDYPLIGIIQNRHDIFCWTLDGRISLQNNEALGDIVGMWEEPRPAVTLTLPCPLKEPQENMWFIDNDFTIVKSMFANAPFVKKFLPQGRCFASEEDAQEWLDAMRNSRR
ncbi:pyruvate kinase [Mannheimia haemolytica]|uniref:pyruvate kinase n=1 Tax=Mannheimia haemolytica TaxID=75985 RepID=UPI003AFAE97A